MGALGHSRICQRKLEVDANESCEEYFIQDYCNRKRDTQVSAGPHFEYTKGT
jgi:hypothetical protein